MLKKSLSIIILAATLLGVGIASAAPTGGGWWVFYQIANVSGSEALVQMQAYQTGDSTAYVGDFSIADGSAVAFHPGLDPTYPDGDRVGFVPDLPDGFEGAVVISSNTPLAAVAQLGNNLSGDVGVDGGTATSFYQGISDKKVATKVMFPTVKHNFNNQTTTFYVQAAGEDASATITYTMNDGSVYDQSMLIAANHMFVFDPLNAGVPSSDCGTAATSPCMGAATVESTTGPIAGVVVEHPHTGTPAPFVLSTRGFTLADQDTKLIAPTIKNNFNGGTTGWSIQNAGDADAVVNVKFTVTNATNSSLIGNEYTDSELIPAGGAVVFSVYRDNLGGMPAGTFAAGIATSVQPLVGSVNESKTMPNVVGDQAKAVYACFGANSATSSVSAPLVKEMFNGKTTGVAVVNVGDVPTTIYAAYTDANGVTRECHTASTIAPGAAYSFYTAYDNSDLAGLRPLEGSKNSVLYWTDNAEPIVALAQESDPTYKALDIKNYEGFNQ